MLMKNHIEDKSNVVLINQKMAVNLEENGVDFITFKYYGVDLLLRTEEYDRPRAKCSNGNSKLGRAIWQFDLPPACPGVCRLCNCWNECYALKSYRQYPDTLLLRNGNLHAYLTDPRAVYDEINRVARFARYFRYFSSGDLPDQAFFDEIVIPIALKNPGCKFLLFTKKYAYVNNWIAKNGALPANLSVVFSAWPGTEMENPYNLPVAMVIFPGEQRHPDWRECSGKCDLCIAAGCLNCWDMLPGDIVGFDLH